MPEYVESFFLDTAGEVKMRVERRADGLLRIPNVPAALRSDDLVSVRRLGRPEGEYRKVTFRKEERARAEHEDTILCSPGHPLFAAGTESLRRLLEERGVAGGAAPFVDPSTTVPYRIHFLSFEVLGETLQGDAETAYAELVAVVDERGGPYQLAPADVMHDLTPGEREAPPPDADSVRAVANWVRVEAQAEATMRERDSRVEKANLRRAYLLDAMTTQRKALEERFATTTIVSSAAMNGIDCSATNNLGDRSSRATEGDEASVVRASRRRATRSSELRRHRRGEPASRTLRACCHDDEERPGGRVGSDGVRHGVRASTWPAARGRLTAPRWLRVRYQVRWRECVWAA